VNNRDMKASYAEWTEKLKNSGFNDIESTSGLKNPSYFRSQPRSSALLRNYSPEKQQYFQLLERFARFADFHELWGADARFYRHIARMYAKGYRRSKVTSKVNAIYRCSYHRDSIARFLRDTIMPACWHWHTHNPRGDLVTINSPEFSVFED